MNNNAFIQIKKQKPIYSKTKSQVYFYNELY